MRFRVCLPEWLGFGCGLADTVHHNALITPSYTMLHLALDPPNLVDSRHRIEVIVALLEQHFEMPLVRRLEGGSVLQRWLTPWELQV